MKMNMEGVVYDRASKISAKGNPYTVLRLKQADNFDYFDVMVDANCADSLKSVDNGDKVQLTLTYNQKYKSFIISEIL